MKKTVFLLDRDGMAILGRQWVKLTQTRVMKSLWERERERDKVGRPPRPLHFFDPAPKAMTKEADMGIRGHSSDLDDVEKMLHTIITCPRLWRVRTYVRTYKSHEPLPRYNFLKLTTSQPCDTIIFYLKLVKCAYLCRKWSFLNYLS